MRPRTAGLSLAAACVCLALPASASADLSLTTQFGSAGTGNGQFQVPQGVAVDQSGNVYAVDQNGDRVEKFDSNGNFLLAWGGPGQLNGPGHIALDPQGNVLVDDSGNYRVLKYSPTGTLIQQYGAFGQGPGQFRSNPRGVAADAAGNVYVIDTGAGGKVNVYQPGGTFTTTWGTAGTGPGQWQAPRGLEVDSAGHVLVGDTGNHEIDVYNPDGSFVRSFGTGAAGPGQLGAPNEIAVDSKGNVFVADTGPGGIVQFAPDGTAVGRTSDASAAGDSFRPYGVAVGPGDDVFATDTLKSRVLRFRQAPPPPVIGQTANAQAATGTVRVKLPGTSSFVDLSKTAATQVPLGSTFDTTHGTVALDLAKDGSGATQSGQFSKGMFTVTQARSNPLTTLTAVGGGLKGCHIKLPRGGAARAVAARKRTRSIFGNAHGAFRTRGHNSAATVRGTQWFQKDTCAGTLTTVKEGTVTVRDFGKRKNVIVRKGKHYLARASRR
jgi:DNA-binding beta-propeller fold protein YncE